MITIGQRASVITTGVVLALASAPAWVQQNTNQTSSAEGLEEVVITGSRIKRSEALDSTVPVTSVSVAELLEQGDVNLGDALNDLPSLRSTYSSGNSTRFIGTAGLNFLDLRGLSISRTLVLVNGRRHITASPGDYLVDVNTIPSDLLERVDVVTGGNSAIYGSDAVAGVVNFITRRNFEGVTIRAQTGSSGQSDRDASFVSLTAGQNFADGRGNVAVALEISQSDPLYFSERDSLTGAVSGRSQFNLAEPTAGEPAAGDGVFDNQFFTNIYNGNIADGGLLSLSCASSVPAAIRAVRCLPNGFNRLFSFNAAGDLVETIPDVDFRPFGSGNVQVLGGNPGSLSTLRNTGQLAAGIERQSVNILANYEFSPAVRGFLEAKFVKVDAVQEGQPSFWQGSIPGFFGSGANLRCDNPFLKASAVAELQRLGVCPASTAATFATTPFAISRFNVDFGGRGELIERETFRIVAGLDGEFAEGWRYEVALNYGRFEGFQQSLNNLLAYDTATRQSNFLLALDATKNAAGQIVCRVNAVTVTRPDCVPINVFGVGAPSREALAFVNTTTTRDSYAEQQNATAFISGDSSRWFSLPGGPVGVAFGLEYRSEEAKDAFEDLVASGATFLNAIQPFNPPKLTVNEYFGELRLPLVSDVPFVKELTLELAGRVSDYNTSAGEVDAYNVGLVWSPMDDLRFRGNLSTSVRTPTQSALYSPLSQNFGFISDPCDVLYIGTNPNRAKNCAAAGVPVGFVNQPARDRSTAFASGGNPTLEAEEGESYTIGGVYTPEALPGLAIAVDYYDIDVKNLIASLGAQTILNECYNAPSGIAGNPFCATVNRNPDFTFKDPAVISGGVNYARQTTRGVDFDVSYRARLEKGHRVSARVIATYVLDLTNYTNPSNPSFPNRQRSELGDPTLGINMNLGYGFGAFDFTYSARFIGKQTIGAYEAQNAYNGDPPQNADQFPRVYYPSMIYQNVRGQYRVNTNLAIYAGVDNLADKMPPLGLLGTAGGDPFDSIGRYFYLGGRYDF
ncbi:MAG: TonB-dependent receptor domain-containing protein [Steroidobacteraceae bacterium]